MCDEALSCGGLAGHLTTIQVACGLLLRGDAAEFVDNIPYLLFGPSVRTDDAQSRRDHRNQ